MQLRVYLAVGLTLALILALLWYFFATEDNQDPVLDSRPLELPVESLAPKSPSVQAEISASPVRSVEDYSP